MKYPILIWTTVIFVIICLIYLPQGYSKYDFSTYSNFNGNENLTEGEINVKWIYLRHQFILKRPIRIDPYLVTINNNINNKGAVQTFYSTQPKDLQVLWNIVIIELLSLFLITGGFFYTFKWYDNRK